LPYGIKTGFLCCSPFSKASRKGGHWSIAIYGIKTGVLAFFPFPFSIASR
jgi:hypothetical protein